MAYYQLEPFGDLIADQRHGIATSVLANIHRDRQRRPDAYVATDFIYWHDVHQVAPQAGILLTDAAAQSALIISSLFAAHLKET
jgi:hypothetical protein